MAEVVYILCSLTSIWCSVLLWRGYLRHRTRLLLWSSLCFVGLAGNNTLLFFDKVLYPNTDMGMPRAWLALTGLLLLLYGLVWDAE